MRGCEALGADCWELLGSAGKSSCSSVGGASVDAAASTSGTEVSTDFVSGDGCATSSEVFSGASVGSGGSELRVSSGCSCTVEVEASLSRATNSSSVGGSDMVDEEDMSDALEDGSSGRERRRSFCRLSGKMVRDLGYTHIRASWLQSCPISHDNLKTALSMETEANNLLWNQI